MKCVQVICLKVSRTLFHASLHFFAWLKGIYDAANADYFMCITNIYGYVFTYFLTKLRMCAFLHCL